MQIENEDCIWSLFRFNLSPRTPTSRTRSLKRDRRLCALQPYQHLRSVPTRCTPCIRSRPPQQRRYWERTQPCAGDCCGVREYAKLLLPCPPCPPATQIGPGPVSVAHSILTRCDSAPRKPRIREGSSTRRCRRRWVGPLKFQTCFYSCHNRAR